MNEEKYLRGALSWQRKIKPTHARLGEEVVSYLRRQAHTLEKNAAIADIWRQVLPLELQPFCRLDKRSGSTLFVQAQPGPYMYQMQLLSGELLERICRQIPRCGIQKICVIPMKDK
ncbi:MAG: DUF721 domain-containing protein [Planctomycetales bacterium]|nr:DUF721 domain-containing protein [Planctomycetales bacterium]